MAKTTLTPIAWGRNASPMAFSEKKSSTVSKFWGTREMLRKRRFSCLPPDVHLSGWE